MQYISKKQMQKIDDLMINHYHVSILQMMKNDAKALARLTKKILNNKKKVLVLLVKVVMVMELWLTTRHLYSQGYKVDVVLAEAISKSTKEVKAHVRTLKTLKIKFLNEKKFHLKDII